MKILTLHPIIPRLPLMSETNNNNDYLDRSSDFPPASGASLVFSNVTDTKLPELSLIERTESKLALRPLHQMSQCKKFEEVLYKIYLRDWTLAWYRRLPSLCPHLASPSVFYTVTLGDVRLCISLEDLYEKC